MEDPPIQLEIRFPVTEQEARDLAEWALEHHEELAVMIKRVVLDAVFR